MQTAKEAYGSSVREMDDPEFFNYLSESEMIPVEIGYRSQIWEIIAPVMRADILAVEDYKFIAEDPLTVPITVVLGNRDKWITTPVVEGWGSHTNDFGICGVGAGHLLAIDADAEVTRCMLDRWPSALR
jgi:surfactin synthase thioesterase subunit